MTLFISVTIVLAIALFLAVAKILVWIEKLFKIENPTYKNALKTLIFYGIASVVVGLIVSVINTGYLSDILVTVGSFFVFHYFLKKYHLSSWKKSLGIYVVFGISSIIIAFIIVIPPRLFIVEPFVVSGDAMSPTYNDGDYLLINKIDDSFERGDVIVFRHTKNQNQFLIERIAYVLSEDEYFVLGDNRLKSLDSRSFGPISRSSIEGKVFYKVSGI